MISRYYFPLSGAKYEMVDVGMFAAANLLRTVQHNVDNRNDPEKRLIQQQRWSTSIPLSKYTELKQTIEQLMRNQIDEAMDKIESFEEDDSKEEMVTAGVGFYYFKPSENQ